MSAVKPRKLCFCSRCGGPDGPGVLIGYSTFRKHTRDENKYVPSATFTRFLASAAVSQSGTSASLQLGVPANSTSALSASSSSRNLFHEGSVDWDMHGPRIEQDDSRAN